LILIFVKNPIIALGLGCIIHYLLQLITNVDHNFFRIIAVAIRTRGRSLTSRHWGGSSLSPLRTRRCYDPKEAMVCV
jgi:type IV secretion system protein VirB3